MGCVAFSCAMVVSIALGLCCLVCSMISSSLVLCYLLLAMVSSSLWAVLLCLFYDKAVAFGLCSLSVCHDKQPVGCVTLFCSMISM